MKNLTTKQKIGALLLTLGSIGVVINPPMFLVSLLLFLPLIFITTGTILLTDKGDKNNE